MWFFGNKKKNGQDVCLLAQTNTVKDDRLEASTTHIESPDTAEAWGLDHKQQCKDEITGQYVQFIGSLNCNPIPIYRGFSNQGTDTALVSSQTEDQEMVYVETGKHKDSRLLWIGICLALLTLTVCIIAFIRVAGS